MTKNDVAIQHQVAGLKATKNKPIYINGEWLRLDQQIDVVNPSNKNVIASVSFGGKEEANHAVEAAYAAFPEWSQLVAGERSKVLKKWYE